MKIEEQEEKTTHLDFQFVVVLYSRADYEKNGTAASGDTEWSGVDFDNSWKAAINRAKAIVSKRPDVLCLVSDRLNRKKDVVI